MMLVYIKSFQVAIRTKVFFETQKIQMKLFVFTFEAKLQSYAIMQWLI